MFHNPSAALEECLFTSIGEVNRHDPELVAERRNAVSGMVAEMTEESRARIASRLERNLRSLAKVKRDLTLPTSRGGFDAARDALLDREAFFGSALELLRRA